MEASAGAVCLIEDTIPLPRHLLLRSRSYVRRLFEVQRLTAREIARRLSVSHSTVVAALASVGLNGHERIHTGPRPVRGQIVFGYAVVDSGS